MSKRKKPPLATLLLLALFLLLASVLASDETPPRPTGPRPDAPPYAFPGPHPVGRRRLVTTGDRALPITLWYPARPGENGPRPISYPYEIKMGPPLGTVTLASFGGRAHADAPYDLSPAAAPYPLVLISPGFSFGGATYAWLAEQLASHGLVVIAPDHQEHLDAELDQLWQATVNRPRDILALLAYVAEQAKPGGDFAGLVDAERVAVAGHSYGGYASLAAAGARLDTAGFAAHCRDADTAEDPAAWLCDELLPHLADMAAWAGLDAVPEGLWPAWGDPRVDAIVPLAGDAFMFGPAGLAGISAPVLAIGGTADSDAPYLWGTQPTYEHTASERKARIALLDADHMIFTGPCQAVPWYLKFVSGEFCADSEWDRGRAHDLINHFVTAFLLAELKQDAAAAAALAPGAVDFPGVDYEAEGY